MTDVKRKLLANLESVNHRIAESCARANRNVDEVDLIAVTKYASIDVLKIIPDTGLSILGESRPQELVKRAALIHEFLSRRARDLEAGAMPRPQWHLVGHLQRNKVRDVIPWADLIHSVDSLRLAEEIDHHARGLDRSVDVLMQVNTSGEQQKHGVALPAAVHLGELLAALPHVNFCGLMTMAPLTDDSNVIYDSFMRCREVFDEIGHEVEVGEHFRHLSMGMSSDFEIAIACGATLIRVGSALFDGIVETNPATADT